jgi:hypothetical protein
MTEFRPYGFRHLPRRVPGRTFMALLLCGVAAAVSAQTPRAPAPAPAPGTGGVQSAPAKLPIKTPRQVADELTVILQRQKTPWQVYASYARIFQDFAAREAPKAGGNGAATGRARLAAQLNQMADLLTSMSEQTKIRDAVRRGAATVPFEQRQTVYAQAGIEHLRLLTEFARLATALPQGR